LLFVDDSAFFRNLLAPVLQAAGYAVTTASGGEEALAILQKDMGFDVIVSDIEMPGMSGFELADAIRANPRTAHVPVIALTSLEQPALIERGRQAGFRDFIAKFDRQGLIAALAEVPREWVEAA
jgi:two-component system chemotaxis sensor kinase CheA